MRGVPRAAENAQQPRAEAGSGLRDGLQAARADALQGATVRTGRGQAVQAAAGGLQRRHGERRRAARAPTAARAGGDAHCAQQDAEQVQNQGQLQENAHPALPGRVQTGGVAGLHQVGLQERSRPMQGG